MATDADRFAHWFSVADLPANRAGHLAPDQARRLGLEAAVGRGAELLVGLGLIVVAIVVAVLGLIDSPIVSTAGMGPTLIGSLIVGLVGSFFLWQGRRGSFSRQVAAGEVDHVTGPAMLSRDRAVVAASPRTSCTSCASASWACSSRSTATSTGPSPRVSRSPPTTSPARASWSTWSRPPKRRRPASPTRSPRPQPLPPPRSWPGPPDGTPLPRPSSAGGAWMPVGRWAAWPWSSSSGPTARPSSRADLSRVGHAGGDPRRDARRHGPHWPSRGRCRTTGPTPTT